MGKIKLSELRELVREIIKEGVEENQKSYNVEDCIIREKISNRGGGVEISLDDFGYEGEKMTAYQNYLGGGILGKIMNDCTISDWRDDSTLIEIARELAGYMYSQTNPDDEWSESSFEDKER